MRSQPPSHQLPATPSSTASQPRWCHMAGWLAGWLVALAGWLAGWLLAVPMPSPVVQDSGLVVRVWRRQIALLLALPSAGAHWRVLQLCPCVAGLVTQQWRLATAGTAAQRVASAGQAHCMC